MKKVLILFIMMFLALEFMACKNRNSDAVIEETQVLTISVDTTTNNGDVSSTGMNEQKMDSIKMDSLKHKETEMEPEMNAE